MTKLFKRVISSVLFGALIVSLALPGSAFATSPTVPAADSYTAINPSEEMQYMTSGSTPSTYAANNAGYRMELNGVTQKLFHTVTTTTTETVTETAPDGCAYYGDGVLLHKPSSNMPNGKPCHVIYFDAFSKRYLYASFTSVSSISYDSPTSVKVTFTGQRLNYYFNESTGAFSNYSGSNPSTSVQSFVISSVVWVDRNIYDSSGNLAFSPASSSTYTHDVVTETSTEYSMSFPSADYTNLTAADRTLSLVGDTLHGEVSGDLTYSFTANNPYIDVELPISAWCDHVPAAEDFWSFSVDGSFAFDLAVGMQGTVTEDGSTYYVLSDLVPSSWQLICNGDLMDGDRCTGSFNSVSSSADGYRASLTIGTGELNFGSVSSGERGAMPETLGFRIYLTSASGGAATTISNPYTFNSVTPYAYIDFTDADGSSGLPPITFHEWVDSGTLSGNVNPDDYSISVNGLGFRFGWQHSVDASPGKLFYGGIQLPEIPVADGYNYVTISHPDYPFLFLSKTCPYWDGQTVNMGATFGSDYRMWSYSSSTMSWLEMPNNIASIRISDPEFVFYSNYNLIDSSGTVFSPHTEPSSTGLAPTSMTLEGEGALENVQPSAGYVSGYGAPILYSSVLAAGNSYQFSNSAMTGYVDVTYPAEVFGVLSSNALLSLSISGNFSVCARVFPALVNTNSGDWGSRYFVDRPTSVQIILNDAIFSDVYPLSYIHDDPDTASVSGLNLFYDNLTYLDTVTFRFQYDVDAHSTDWDNLPLHSGYAFSVGADCWIYIAPIFTAEIDKNAATRFDDSNIVNWLKKIHGELADFLPQFSIHFQSVVDHMTTQTNVLNDVLEALQDNSAVESVSSTVTNIYNSISNVETSISNVESTINNVSNTITEMSGTMSGMQQTQQEMQETQKEMEEDTSALRDMYASDQDLQLKEDTAPIVEEIADSFFGSDSDTAINTETVKDTQTALQGVGTMFSSGYEISDAFEEIGSNDDFMLWFSVDTASALDSTGSAASVSDDDPFNMWRYAQQISSIRDRRGGDD